MLARGARTYVLFNCSTVVTALIACQTLTSNCSRAACSWMKHVLKPSEPMQLHAESRRRGRPPSLSNRLTRASWGVWWSCNSCCQRHRSMTIICYCFRYVCHELRNPLHAIAGLVETEDAGPGSTSKKEVLDLCAHMRTILDDMLDLGKVRNRNSAVLVNDVLVISMQWTGQLRAGKMQMSPSETDVRALAASAARGVAAWSRAHIVVETDSHVPSTLLVDPQRLKQVRCAVVICSIASTRSKTYATVTLYADYRQWPLQCRQDVYRRGAAAPERAIRRTSRHGRHN
jgi:hypothetical protein